MASDPKASTGVPSYREFIAAVGRTGILAEEPFERLREQVERGEAPGDPTLLAEHMVREGLLTEFQASRLRVGKGDSLVVGNYTLIEWIGAGAMGVVFKARHQLMDRVVALKAISSQGTKNPNVVPRFLREMRLVGLLDHPNVVRAFDAGMHKNAPYFVMEFLSGEDLDAVLRNRKGLPPEEVVGYMTQAARGLAHAHEKGVIHRDIKPSNLFVDSAGHLKILDLGLGGFFEGLDAEFVRHGEGRRFVVGTADYMSPEQASGEPLDARTDLYSLGCAMYRLLTEAYPFPGATKDERLQKRVSERHVPIRQVRPDLPPDLAAVVERMLAQRPEERFATAADTADALESLACAWRRDAPGRGAKRRAPESNGAASRPAPEPDLPLLNSSLIEAALKPKGSASPDPPPPRGPDKPAAEAPPVNEPDQHSRPTEVEDEQSGRDLHRLYNAELFEIRRAEREAAEGNEGVDAPPGGESWFETVGERLGDSLAEPTATKVLFLLLVIALALMTALGLALS